MPICVVYPYIAEAQKLTLSVNLLSVDLETADTVTAWRELLTDMCPGGTAGISGSDLFVSLLAWGDPQS